MWHRVMVTRNLKLGWKSMVPSVRFLKVELQVSSESDIDRHVLEKSKENKLS